MDTDIQNELQKIGFCPVHYKILSYLISKLDKNGEDKELYEMLSALILDTHSKVEVKNG